MNFCALGRPMAVIICAALISSTATASGLIYTPINPAFGGNPNNGPVLMSVAQAQNDTKAPQLTQLQKFNNALQQAILNHISTQVLNTMFGASNTLTPGTFDTGSYTVVVSPADSSGNITITTTDKSSGAVATFEVSSNSFNP